MKKRRKKKRKNKKKTKTTKNNRHRLLLSIETCLCSGTSASTSSIANTHPQCGSNACPSSGSSRSTAKSWLQVQSSSFFSFSLSFFLSLFSPLSLTHPFPLVAESQKARDAVSHSERNLVYDEAGKEAQVDLFYPETGMTGTTPILVFIHGGYWQAMT